MRWLYHQLHLSHEISYQLDPEFTKSAASFEDVVTAKMHLAYKENYVAEVEIYYSPGF